MRGHIVKKKKMGYDGSLEVYVSFKVRQEYVRRRTVSEISSLNYAR